MGPEVVGGQGIKGNSDGLPTYEEGYLNLADAVGMGRNRDTSTYYHGPQRGMTERASYQAACQRYGVDRGY